MGIENEEHFREEGGQERVGEVKQWEGGNWTTTDDTHAISIYHEVRDLKG